jgi:hypothetical protein
MCKFCSIPTGGSSFCEIPDANLIKIENIGCKTSDPIKKKGARTVEDTKGVFRNP